MEKNLADLFECVADAVPEREAVVCAGRRSSYAALEERANRLAHHLAGAGLGPGDHVACYLYNGTEYLETMLAAYKLRAAPVNVNWRYLAGELAYLLADSEAKAVVFDTRFAATLAEVIGDLPLLSGNARRMAVGPGDATSRGPDAVPYEDALAASSPERRFAARSAGDRYLLYTGGTTGLPKGVMWRHEDIIAAGLGGLGGAGTPDEVAERARRSQDRAFPACPLMHGAAQWVSLAALLGGGTVILSPDPTLDARALVRLAAGERVTVLTIVGDAVGRPLADALEELAGDSEVDLSALRVILSGGAFLSPGVKEELLARLPGAVVYDTYGSSESGTFARSVSGAGQSPPQGRFAGSAEAVVLGDDLRPVAPGSGEVGRLARSGPVALGYYNDPEKTAATFPVIDGVRYVVTGDHAIVEADRTIVLLGRGSACINTGGEKVYPDEVEAALKSHPAVADAMVVGVPDERFGERVVALVAFREPVPPPAADLDAHVRGLIAGYKAPRAIVPVEAIERFPSGKPDYAWGRSTALERLGSGVIP